MEMSLRELKEHRRNIRLDVDKMERAYAGLETNHVLHAIISIFTVGMWVLVWVVLFLANNDNRKKLAKKLDESRLALMEIEDSIEELQQS